MDWWNSFLDWAHSGDGWRIISGAIVPFVAIVVAGVVAALIGRGATKRVITLQERESKNAAVGGVISAARKAATWGSLGHDERSYADHLAEDADIRLRLLPISGAAVAANWAQHEIADIKKNSSTFSFQAEQSLAEFRDRMLEWQAKPTRARKLFRYDLERWKFETPDSDTDLVQRQQQWNADQAAPTSAPAAGSTPTTTALRPAAQPTTPIAGGSAVAGSTAAAVPDGAPARTGGTVPARPAGAVPTTAGSAASAGATAASASDVSSASGRGSDARTGDTAAAETRAGGAAASGPTDASASTAPGGFGSDASRPVEASAHANAAATRSSDATTPLGGAPYGSRPAPVIPTANTGSNAGPTSPAGPATTASPVESRSEERAEDRSTERPGSADHADDSDRETAVLSDATVDATSGPGHNTTSIPTRITDAPAEPADPDETNEAPYASPLSASELRRRAEEDDE